MSERIVDEVCVSCGHSAGQHFQDVIGKVRCLQFRITTSQMTGEAHAWPCSCVDYAMTNPQQERAKWR